MDRLEGLLNYVCPKSIILYGEKRASAKTSPRTQEGTAERAAA